jgi:Leucine-rich repeat (LRR) protein
MGEEYGREEWQEDEAAATAEAIRRIEAAIASGETVLDFTDLSAMTRLPDALAGAQGVREIYASIARPGGSRPAIGAYRRLEDLSVLASLSALTWLDLSQTRVTDLSALAGLSALTSLDLSYTSVTDLSALAGLSALTSLDLSGTRVTDLSVLMQIPLFAAETAQSLRIQGTPAARSEVDPNMEALSGLPPDRCAIETVQYLKGTHPLNRDPLGKGNGGTAGAGLAGRLADASPVAIQNVDGKLEAVNPGAPQRVNALEAGQRIEGLRHHVALVLSEARQTQCGAAVLRRLEAYANGLAGDPPIFFVIDAPMQMLRGSLDDSYLMEAVDRGLEQGLKSLVVAHDALRPFLLPPTDEEIAAVDALPPIQPGVTPNEVAVLAQEAIEALSGAEVAEKVGGQLVNTLKAIEELALSLKDRKDPAGPLRRVIASFGGTLSVLADAIALHAWWLGPAGVALAGRIQPSFERIMGLFM